MPASDFTHHRVLTRRERRPLFSCPKPDRLPQVFSYFFETVPVDPRPTPEPLTRQGAPYYSVARCPCPTPRWVVRATVDLRNGSVRSCYLRPVLVRPAGRGTSPGPRQKLQPRDRHGRASALQHAHEALHGLARSRLALDPTRLGTRHPGACTGTAEGRAPWPCPCAVLLDYRRGHAAAHATNSVMPTTSAAHTSIPR